LTVIKKRTFGLLEKGSAAVSIWPVPVSNRQQRAGPRARTPQRIPKETVMKKIVASLFISLDGVIGGVGQRASPWFSPQLGQAAGSMIAARDAKLLGRVTYDAFAAHCPDR
jgi:hypothetical protein